MTDSQVKVLDWGIMGAAKLKIKKLWEYTHVRAIDSFSLAGRSGDLLLTDRRENVILIGPDGRAVWEKKVGFSPYQGKITEDGQFIYLLTYAGRLMKINREAELEWDQFVDRDGRTLAIRTMGQVAVVASQKGRFHVIDKDGERRKVVHTKDPVIHARFSAASGKLIVASARGWVGFYDKEFTNLGEYNINRAITEVEVSQKGSRLFLPSRDQGLNIIELENDNMTTYTPGFPVSEVGIDETGDLIAVVGICGSIALLDFGGNILWKTATGHSLIHCEMNRKGDRFITISDRGEAEMYQIGTDNETTTMESFDFVETGPEPITKKDSNDHFDFLEV